MRQQRDYREDYPADEPDDGVDCEDDYPAAEDALAALEPVVDGENVSEREKEAREELSDHGEAVYAEHQPAEEDADDGLAYVDEQHEGDALDSEDAVEVREPGVAAAVVADVLLEYVLGRDYGAVYASEQVGDDSHDEQHCDHG